MKKMLIALFALTIVLSNPIIAEAVSYFNTTSGMVITDISYLKVTFVNQEPSTAEPGGYVDLLFKLENRGTVVAENVTFELLPAYPFSLDPGISAARDLGTLKGLQSGDNAFLIRYKVRVDKDAINGENEIKLKYSYGNGEVYYIQTFNVSVSNPRTDFDVIIQDSAETSATLAIANTGSNTAYSVIIKIPQQENFRVTGTSATIIGNLNAGDYTLATFQMMSTTEIANVSNISRRMPSTGATTSFPMNREKNLTVEISYTDLLGIRRTIQKEVQFELVGGTGTLSTQRNQTQILGNGGLTYIIIGAVGIVVIIVLFKLRKRKKK
jgi:hypothetical protein